jgi:hypothetical protein
MKAIIRDAAFADLERISAWIARDQPVAAARVIALILENIERLARFPLMGHAGRVEGTLEWVVPPFPTSSSTPPISIKTNLWSSAFFMVLRIDSTSKG